MCPVRLIAVSIAVGLLLVGGQQAVADELPPDSWLMPFEVNHRPRPSGGLLPIIEIKSQTEVYDFMWQSFVASVWPWKNGGSRGEPDRDGKLAPWNTGEESQGPVVWQTYRRPATVFIKPKFWPISWDDPAPELLCTESGVGSGDQVIIPSEDRIIGTSTNYSNNFDALNQPFIQANYPTGPVLDQNRNYLRYEVGLNQSYFSYIKFFRYYNPKRQEKSVKRYMKFVEKNGKAPPPSNKRSAKYFQGLPNGLEPYLVDFFALPDYALHGIVEWKAAWKILEEGDALNRFYWRYVFFVNPDGTCEGPVKAGLVAFHIHRVTPFGHIGTTFEQVDNTRLQPEYSKSEMFPEAAELPETPNLNPGGDVAYDNGYQVCDPLGIDCESGLRGLLPKNFKQGDPIPPKTQRPFTNIVRQVEIPEDVQEVNAKWRKRLAGTVWFYYQMIGTQNKNLNIEPNPNLGPGVIGAQSSNTTNLINTALESYTQKGWSCALCHQNAFPLGVSLPFPPFEQNFAPLHTISFLLQTAKSNKDN